MIGFWLFFILIPFIFFELDGLIVKKVGYASLLHQTIQRSKGWVVELKKEREWKGSWDWFEWSAGAKTYNQLPRLVCWKQRESGQHSQINQSLFPLSFPSFIPPPSPSNKSKDHNSCIHVTVKWQWIHSDNELVTVTPNSANDHEII